MDAPTPANKDIAMEHVEDGEVPQSIDAKSEVVEDDMPLDQQRRILRRVDLRVTVVTGVLFFISLLDRSNLGAAAIAGMTVDLNLGIENRFNLVAMIFFVPYIIFEFPGAVLVRTMGPRIFLAGICVLWGVSMLCFGFVQNWVQLVGLRVLLGAFEAGYFPACIYLVSTYYTRFEVQKRFAAFYLIATTAGAFSGILAYGLMQMNGLAGKAGWRWIFIMEGILTVVIGAIGYFLLVDFPDKAHQSINFLTKDEAAWVIRRIQRDRNDAEAEKFDIRKFLGASKDVKLWCFSLIFLCLTTVSYAVTFFLPIILRNNLGFSIAAAQCLVAPPWVFAAFAMYFCGWLGDKYRIRGPIILTNSVIAIVGLIVMTWAPGSGAKYFGSFLILGGIQANVPTAMAFQSNNIRGQWKRAFGSATLVCGGGLGGVAGSLIFRTQDAPRYLNGIYGCIVANVLIIIIVSTFDLYFLRKNRLAKAGKILIDNEPGFLYTL